MSLRLHNLCAQVGKRGKEVTTKKSASHPQWRLADFCWGTRTRTRKDRTRICSVANYTIPQTFVCETRCPLVSGAKVQPFLILTNIHTSIFSQNQGDTPLFLQNHPNFTPTIQNFLLILHHENRIVAQLVAHYVRDVGVGRSSRLYPTLKVEGVSPFTGWHTLAWHFIISKHCSPVNISAPSAWEKNNQCVLLNSTD